MKCSFCSEEINDTAIVCPKCRHKLQKSPAAAAALNFFFWGAGYLYCGRQWGIAILIPCILLNLWAIAAMEPSGMSPDLMSVVISNIPGLLMGWHAYKMIESDNQNRIAGTIE